MPIPVFTSQIVAASTWTVKSGAGATLPVPATQYYHLVTSKTTAGNGQSFLTQLGTLLSSSGGITWTLTLDANLHVKMAHNSGSGVVVAFDANLAYGLGVDIPAGSTGLATFTVPAGAGISMSFRPWWLWCPEMLISNTGPELFDPTTTSGIRSSPGSAARAPDSTASFVSNGVVTEAQIIFNGVQYYKRARPATATNFPGDSLLREDFETWWRNGPALGRRILMWRNRNTIIGSAAPATSSVTIDYVEYYPDAAMRAAPSIKATSPVNLGWWDISLTMWLTERGEVLYT